jgi:hypothetical protein
LSQLLLVLAQRFHVSTFGSGLDEKKMQ